MMSLDLASHSKKIRVGQAPIVLPDWHPLRVAEDVALLDNMTEGRVDFGVAKGTNEATNKNAFDMIKKDTIFTNVGLTKNNEPWWESKDIGEPAIDWKGKEFNSDNGPAAHPNSRFTVSAKNNPSYSSLAEAPDGVPISAIVFGGRRKK